MDEILQSSQPSAEKQPLDDHERQALVHRLAEGQATVVAHDESDIHALGQIGSRPLVTAGGEVLTNKDRAAELHTREVQGHSYQR